MFSMQSSEIQDSQRFKEPVPLTILRGLLLQGSDAEEREPISGKEFYSGIILVSGALSVFALLTRVFGG